jgi:HlyD family secretion protein
MGRYKLLITIVTGVILVAAAAYFGYFGFQAPATGQPAAQVTPPPTVSVDLGTVRQLVSAPGALIETQIQNLTIGVSGWIEKLDVQPGDQVKKGQELARLGDKNKYEAAVTSAHLDLLSAQHELDELVANAPKVAADVHSALIQAEDDYKKAQKIVDALKFPRASQDRIDSSYADYRSALENVALAQQRYDNTLKYSPDDPRRVEALKILTDIQAQKDQLLAVYNWITAKPTQKDIDDAQVKLDQTKAIFENAQRQWERVKSGPDSMELALSQAKVDAKKLSYQQAQDDLSHLILSAPIDGVITDVKVKVGDQVNSSTVVITILNPKEMQAKVTVVEEDFALIQNGQEAQLYFDAQPEAQVVGHVERIVPSRTSDSQPTYPVYLSIGNLPSGLAPGMSVDSSIVIAEKKNVLVLPKALVRARTDGTATVQVWSNEKKETREIKIGLIGDQNVEILSGLQKGEQVVGQ